MTFEDNGFFEGKCTFLGIYRGGLVIHALFSYKRTGIVAEMTLLF